MFGLLAVVPPPPAAAKMKQPISVYPTPGTVVASYATTFSFRGIKKSQLGPIVVRGQRSGLHRGRLLAHSDGRGVSFIPKRRFKPGEIVNVRTWRWIRGARNGRKKQGRFHVRIGRFFGSFGKDPIGSTDKPKGTLHSRPDLGPPELQVSTLTPEAQDGMLFFAPRMMGTTIADRQGRIVWFNPVEYGSRGDNIFDFRPQTYQGRPVLTYWKGVWSWANDSKATFRNIRYFDILNRKYQRIARIKPGNGYRPDIHDFVITPWNTALMIAYQGTGWDTRKVGGIKKGRVMDNLVQEIDIKTGAVLFEWHSLGNVGIKSSYAPVPKDTTPFDYFHMNSIQPDGPNAFLISGRKTSSVYRINRWNGKIRWTLRGAGRGRNDFRMGPGTSFGYQHDAHRLPNGDLSVFDNGVVGFSAPNVNDQSSGLVLRLRKNGKRRTATLVRRNEHKPDPIVSASQGNAQGLPNDGMFVGWGDQFNMTEFDRDGNITFDAAFPDANGNSYRAYKAPWNGIPKGRPAIASRIAPDGEPEGLTVWASWNGASKIAEWRVLTGPDAAGLTEAKVEPWANLETEIDLPGPVAAKVQVEALDQAGKVIGQTAVIDAGSRAR